MGIESLQGDLVSHVTDIQRAASRAKLRQQIASGEVDLGPMADQSDVIVDIRDKRDPSVLGTTIMRMVEVRSDVQKATEAADLIAKLGIDVPDYADMGYDHAQARLDELRRRAEQGDKFAAALLRGETLAEDPVE